MRIPNPLGDFAVMSPYLSVARALALQAGERIMTLRESPLVKEHKADDSLVTNADREADQLIREGLRAAFPDHGILTEENGLIGNADSEFLWVVDPLDGTRAYAKGVIGFSVMIGLLRRREPFAGVVFDPKERHYYEAERGQGSFHEKDGQRTRMQVSERRELSVMPLITSTGFPETTAKQIRQHWPCPWLPAVNSVGVKVGIVTRQVADIYLNHHGVHLWDTVAPQIILEEAGGRITYLDGTSLRYALQSPYEHPGPTLASNGTCHEALLKTVAPLMAGRRH